MVHPPSVNTPFYSHAGSVMQETPRPPPPVYQPEMLGEAIFLAGTVNRREWVVGEQSTAIKLLNGMIPEVLDVAAGAVGVRAQQTTREDVSALRDPNIFSPSKEVRGTHGPFDRELARGSLQWQFAKRSGPARAGFLSIGLGLATLGASAATAFLFRDRS